MDCMNPSSNLGWFEKERYSFIQRANFDAVVAFAFEHHLTIANNVPLGGHVIIEDLVIIGGNSAVQQFTRIGRLAMIGGMTGVLKDVIPFGLSFGNRNYLKGINLIGLRRNKYKNKLINYLKIYGGYTGQDWLRKNKDILIYNSQYTEKIAMEA